ncbi:MAG: GAF domain-containing protein [Bacteroidales bacterium]|nr:GAF domain-containing protein [Bacteroidales bacterium]MDD4671366.1 GAF domain-containing protein [Bacteroidales bacterium]MDY0348573.1 GAF domain-containing protein [Tenuifilaceae bacterium]
MKYKLNLQRKIIITVVGVSAIIYAVALGYVSISAKKVAIADAIAVTQATAEKYASDMRSLLEKDLVTAQTLANSVKSYSLMPNEQWKEVFPFIYHEVMVNNQHLLSVWDSWELSVIDKSYAKSYGRYQNEVWREGGSIESKSSLASLDGDSEAYARLKAGKKERVENPYFSNFTGNEKDNILMTSIMVPLVEDESYTGVIGLDIALETYHDIVRQIRPFENSYAFLLSNDLKYVAHPNINNLGESATIDYEIVFSNHDATERIVNGQEITFWDNDIDNTYSYFTLTPIVIGKTGSPWSLAVVVPQSVMLAQANKNFYISLLVGLIGLILITAIIVFFSRSIFSPVKTITNTLKRMAKGVIAQDMILEVNSTDEIGEMTNALNITTKALSNKVGFATQIGQGNLDTDIEMLSDKDSLGKALVDMRNNLRQADEDNKKRAVEDDQRRWANEGIAKFGELLRQNNDNIEKLSKSIIRELVNKLEANQGGLFLYNNDDPNDCFFELKAAFAYNRFKYKQKKILPGEGLIGACALEKKYVYLTEIPPGYIEITSGLGQSTPTSLIIVPLMVDDEVLGVFEIASFNTFEPYQIEFLEKIAQSIASTIVSVRVSITTNELLTKTQQQAEEMLAQEEEMRQNMEELQATQEESTRKTSEMQSFIDALNISNFVIEYDSQGYITAVNDSYLNLLNLSRDEVIGTHHTAQMELTPKQEAEYDTFWSNLRHGIPQKQVNKFVVNDKPFVFQETYTPIKNDQDEVYKVLKIANNITHLVAGQL